MSDGIYSVIDNQIKDAKRGRLKEIDFDKETWAARKKAEREEAFALVEKATEAICANPANFKDYLDVLAKFNNYSTSNSLLIYAQRPGATLVGDFDYWKRQEAFITRGESGMMILEPGRSYEREDGSEGTSYNVKRVFDISQTSARTHIPRQWDIQQVLTALVTRSPVAVVAQDTADKAAHYTHETRTITVARGLDVSTLFKALATEFAHADLAKDSQDYTREENSAAAQTAAYVICRRFGIDAAGLEPQSAPRFEEGKGQELRVEIGRIRNAAKDIAKHIDRYLEQPKDKEQPVAEKGGRDER